MNSLLNIRFRENYLLFLTMASVFFFTYWVTQLGFFDFIFLILPRVSAIFQVIAFSVLLLPIFMLINAITYYIEIVLNLLFENDSIFTDSIKKKILMGLLTLSFLSLFCSSVFIILINIVLLGGFYLEKKFNVSINHDFVRTNHKINWVSVIIFLLATIYFGHHYAKYTEKHYSASTVTVPGIPLDYLGNLLGQNVIRDCDKILFLSDALISKK